jgi:hypothetical protein
MIFVRGDMVILEYAVRPPYSNAEAVRSSPVWNRAHTKSMSTNSHAGPVFREAIFPCAPDIVLVHNHPSGDTLPPRGDAG